MNNYISAGYSLIVAARAVFPALVLTLVDAAPPYATLQGHHVKLQGGISVSASINLYPS